MSSTFAIDVRTSFELAVFANQSAPDLQAYLDQYLHGCTGPIEFPDVESYMACACEWVSNAVTAWLVHNGLPRGTVSSVMMVLMNGKQQTERVCLNGRPMGM
jgi:hypothetical protein